MDRCLRLIPHHNSLRTPRIVRVGLIQNQIVRPTTDPVLDQASVLYGVLAAALPAAYFDAFPYAYFRTQQT